MLAWILAACTQGHLEGRVVDGWTGAPAAGVALHVTAAAQTSMGCMAFDATTDADGRFRIEGTCDVAYQVKAAGDDAWFPDGGEIPAGTQDGITLALWNTPKAPGVYEWTGGSYEPLRTVSDLKTRRLAGTEVDVQFPSKLGKLPLIEGDERLVLVGRENTASLAPVPLRPGPPVTFDLAGELRDQGAWVYLGVDITAGKPPTAQPATATLDPAAIVAAERGDRTARVIAPGALPPGRYAWLSPGDKRIYAIDFGVAGDSPTAPPADGGADAAPGEAPPGAP